ncbi:MAG: hypothetical protein ACTHM1_05230 [Solirubrobacteraceae bacterium]
MEPQLADGYTAGRYNVQACTATVGYVNHSWQARTSNPTYIETHTAGCGEEPADYGSSTLTNLELGDVTGLSEEIPVGTEGTWSVTAPNGTTIAEVNGYSSLYRQGHSWHVYRETENTNGETSIESTCDKATTNACALGGAFQATALKARTMTFGVLCTPEEYEPGKYFTTCPDGALVHDVRAGIAYATVTIEDPNAPEAVTAGSIPSGPQHGMVNITASATDSTAGLLSLSVITKTGEVIGGPVTPGACDYSQLTPCPTHVENAPISIETEKLPDGQSELRVAATNAAHDESYSTPFIITVENHPPPPKEEGSNGSASGGTTQAKQEGPQSATGTGGQSGAGTATQETEGSTRKGAGSATSTTLLPFLPIRVRTHLARHKLIVECFAPRRAAGWLWLHISGRSSDRHHWTSSRIGKRLRHGLIRVTVALPKLHRSSILKLTVLYPGGKLYRRTTRVASIST